MRPITSTLLAGLALCLAAPAYADDELAEHPCVREAAKWVTMESYRVVSLSPPKAEIIEYAGTRLMAYKFTLVVSPKAGGRPESFECFTSEDRRRVLQFRAG